MGKHPALLKSLLYTYIQAIIFGQNNDKIKICPVWILFVKNFRHYFIAHSWWGKLLGAFFGYLAGGPAGALLGILIGNIFDRGLVAHLSRPHWFFFTEKRKAVQRVFFKATFAIMGHIAKADGRVSEQEIQMANLLMDEMRLNKKEKNLAKQYFREGKAKDFDVISMLHLLEATCRINPELLKLFVDIQYRAAKIDGLTEKKITTLNIIFQHLGLAPLHRQYRFYQDFGFQNAGADQQHSSSSQSKQTHTAIGSLSQAYSLLEVTPNSGKQEVKRAYRRMISRNHPDKLIAQGLPEQMIKMANEKTQKIRKAYEYICIHKGWNH